MADLNLDGKEVPVVEEKKEETIRLELGNVEATKIQLLLDIKILLVTLNQKLQALVDKNG